MSFPADDAKFIPQLLMMLQPHDDVHALERMSDCSHTQSVQGIVVVDGARLGARRRLASRIATFFEYVGRSTLPSLPRILGEVGWSLNALSMALLVK